MSPNELLQWAFVAVPGATAGLYLLHRLGLWAEARGWIYYRNKKGTGGSFHNAAMELERFYKPSVGHSIVAEDERVESQEKDGE